MSSHYSINRVKAALANASGRTSKRAARLRIVCLMWLGRWGWTRGTGA